MAYNPNTFVRLANHANYFSNQANGIIIVIEGVEINKINSDDDVKVIAEETITKHNLPPMIDFFYYNEDINENEGDCYDIIIVCEGPKDFPKTLKPVESDYEREYFNDIIRVRMFNRYGVPSFEQAINEAKRISLCEQLRPIEGTTIVVFDPDSCTYYIMSRYCEDKSIETYGRFSISIS